VSLTAPVLRVATGADLDAIAGVMRASVLELFPLYHAFGFREVEALVLTMLDGVTIDAVVMERPIDLLKPPWAVFGSA
jgi:hypothetical protein